MRTIRTTHGASLHRATTTVAALSLLALAAAGCAAGGASAATRALRPPPPGSALLFENAGTERVKLYLAERGSEWFLGYVLPGRTEAFRLPPAVAASSVGRQLSLVVVPSTASRSWRGTTGTLPGALTSEAFNLDHLTSMRWRLVGRWVVAVP